jgi:hypothetical protein
MPNQLRDKFNNIINSSNSLVDDWHTGVLQAVNDFSPQTMTDKNLALEGNMLWAATCLRSKNPWLVIPGSFIGAYIGTTGGFPSGFSKAAATVRSTYTKKMNDLRNLIENNMDKILFTEVTTYGIDSFMSLNVKEQRQKLWSWLFDIDWNNGDIIESSKIKTKIALESCDNRTKDFLEKLQKYWTKSFTTYALDIVGPYWIFNESEWYRLTNFPIEDYAGASASGINLMQIRNKNIPPSVDQNFANQRAAKIFIKFMSQLPQH